MFASRKHYSSKVTGSISDLHRIEGHAEHEPSSSRPIELIAASTRSSERVPLIWTPLAKTFHYTEDNYIYIYIYISPPPPPPPVLLSCSSSSVTASVVVFQRQTVCSKNSSEKDSKTAVLLLPPLPRVFAKSLITNGAIQTQPLQLVQQPP